MRWDYDPIQPEYVHMRIAAEQIIYTMHNPGKAHSIRTTIGMIPKKSDGPLALHFSTEGWGIRAIQGFALYKILVWIGSSSFLGLVFAGLWLAFVGKADLQNAFIPYSFLATMLMMALGIPQFLNVD